MALVSKSRHGKSQQNWALQALLAGDWDVYYERRRSYHNAFHCSLTPEGMQQAEELRPFLRQLAEGKRVVVYASPQTRALQTAAIAGHGWAPEPFIDMRLRERSYGDSEDIVYTPETFPEYSRQAEEAWRNPHAAMPGGESVADRWDDAVTFLRDIHERHTDPNEYVAIFGHGEFSRILMMAQEGARVEDWPKYQFPVHNCYTVAYSRRCPSTGELYTNHRWRLTHCPKTNPVGLIRWEELTPRR